MISNNDILNYLIQNKDEKYKKFSSSLIPNCSNMLGVRIPLLRKLAKNIAKENDVKIYLTTATSNSFEEVMLQGLVIGYSNLDINSVIEQTKIFVSKIDNWSICDSLCNSLKITNQYPNEMFDYISIYINSTKEYELRFMLVMLLCYFVNDKHIYDIFNIIEQIKNNDYYVEMAVAWLLSVCYISYPKETLEYIKTASISTFCYNKAIQKMIESYRISNDDKNKLKQLKKKFNN